ncbi:MAG: hypothetical protein JNL97_08900, partial [Verrucomicrobiales bacterium]|nr:hypothetical protein [Verrucomicrobiales bacterium]
MNRGVALIAGLVLALPASIPAARGQCMIWTLRTDVGGPGPQTRHCMVYNPDRRRIVLFGSDDFADLWEYDGLRWLRVFVTGPRPSPRVDAAMAYDAVRRELVLVGGFGRAENDYLADTWTCRFSTDATGNVVGAWTRRQDFPDYAEPDPEDASGQMGESGARAEHSLVYDDVAGVVHLFGGRARIVRGARYQRPFNRKNYSSGSGMWNGNAWVRRRWNDTRARAPIDIDWPTGLPGRFLDRLELGRKAIAATFDGRRGRIVTFGGLRQIYQR